MDSTAVLNPLEEVKKLQEMVRQLERQNEELRKGGQGDGGGGGLAGAAPAGLLMAASTDSLVGLQDDQLDREQTWLFCSSSFDAAAPDLDIDLWLLQLRRQHDLDEAKANAGASAFAQRPAAEQQRQFDTRTFTRPKKRLMPLSVAKSSNSDLTNMRVSSTENLLNDVLHSRQRESSLPRYNLDQTFHVAKSEGRSTPDRLSNGRLTPSGVHRSRLEPQLNRTFNLDQSHNDLDEDQISSASDSSFSSSHRAALTAGEVKTLARLQEESLKYSSTPAWNHIESRVLSPDLPSPITRSTEDFHSDHSSRSSVVGDSLHSSPTGSPYGSNQALTRVSDGVLIGSNETLDRPARLLKQRVEGSGLARPMLSARSRGSSLIKPQCLVRPVVKSGESGIPRPQGGARVSRIPPPRTKIAPKTQEWMDGCY